MASPTDTLKTQLLALATETAHLSILPNPKPFEPAKQSLGGWFTSEAFGDFPRYIYKIIQSVMETLTQKPPLYPTNKMISQLFLSTAAFLETGLVSPRNVTGYIFFRYLEELDFSKKTFAFPYLILFQHPNPDSQEYYCLGVMTGKNFDKENDYYLDAYLNKVGSFDIVTGQYAGYKISSILLDKHLVEIQKNLDKTLAKARKMFVEEFEKQLKVQSTTVTINRDFNLNKAYRMLINMYGQIKFNQSKETIRKANILGLLSTCRRLWKYVAVQIATPFQKTKTTDGVCMDILKNRVALMKPIGDQYSAEQNDRIQKDLESLGLNDINDVRYIIHHIFICHGLISCNEEKTIVDVMQLLVHFDKKISKGSDDEEYAFIKMEILMCLSKCIKLLKELTPDTANPIITRHIPYDILKLCEVESSTDKKESSENLTLQKSLVLGEDDNSSVDLLFSDLSLGSSSRNSTSASGTSTPATSVVAPTELKEQASRPA